MLDRRRLIKTVALSSLAAPALLVRAAQAAEFTLKYGNNAPASHPVTLRMQEAAAKIQSQTSGRVEVLIFPNNQLGDDINMLSQVRSGALHLLTISGGPLSTRAPGITIQNTAFAFKNYDQVWSAMDGALGSLIRSRIRSSGFQVLDRVWDNGFRHITMGSKPIRSPDDLKGVKFRVGASKEVRSVFQTLGAVPTTIIFAELYSSLQTKLVDGEENGLVLIEAAKLYEVQKFCSLTSHIWDCQFMIGNKSIWDKLPKPIQEIIATALEEAAAAQRIDSAELDKRLQSSLEAKNLVFNSPDVEEFKAVLRKSGFYTEWRETYGSEAWSLLEGIVGPLG